MKNQKNYRKIFGLFILIIFCAGIFAGCSSGEGVSFSNSSNSIKDYAYDGAANESGSSMMMDTAAPSAAVSLTSASANLPADRKIIRDANISMEVEDVENSYNNMLKLLATYNGYEAGRNMYDNGDNNTTITATLKIPADKLDTFLSGLKDEGKVISQNISSNDITDQYFDSQIRLDTLRQTLENYKRFLENAKDVDEQLSVTSYINDVTQQIEQLEGSLKRWDSLINYSTVTLNLYRPYQAPEPVREIKWDSLSLSDMGWFIKSGFLGVVNAIFSVIQWFVIAVISASPVLIPVVIIIILIVRHNRKNKKNGKNKYAQYNTANTANSTNQNNQPDKVE